MATRPTLHRAVQGTKNTASDYNDNFDDMMDFIDNSIGEAKDYVDSFMPSVTGQSGKFLTTDGTDTSWIDLLASGNTYSGGNTFSGNNTFSGTNTFAGTVKVPATTTTGTALQLVGQSKSSNGYIKLGSGIIIQWGRVSSMGNNTDKQITLPTAFTSTNYSVGGSTDYRQYSGDKASSWRAYDYNTSYFKIQSEFEQSSNNTIRWIAIGY